VSVGAIVRAAVRWPHSFVLLVTQNWCFRTLPAMTRTLAYTLAIETGHEIDPTPSACSVDLDDLLQNGSCTVEVLKEHIKGSLGELAPQQQYCCSCL